jgi:NAD-dependent dihydropyrimidine dehydrogenase PreA subunit/nitroreductase
MITINQEKCNACGLCVKVCHEYCMLLENGLLTIDFKYCSTCSQCIAICPEQALSWDNHKPEFFDKSLYPDPEQVGELFKERRTIRDYTGKKIDRSILEEIAGYAIFAPTHNFNFRIIIIDDEKIIEEANKVIYQSSKNIYQWFYKPKIIHSLIKTITPDREHEYLKARPKLENVIKRKGRFKSKPAAIILVIGDRRVPLSLESAQYALYNMDLYAQSKGIACRNLVGNQMILNRNSKYRKMIGLNRNERIFGTMTMGYPAVKFRNKVTGKKISIQWI